MYNLLLIPLAFSVLVCIVSLGTNNIIGLVFWGIVTYAIFKAYNDRRVKSNKEK